MALDELGRRERGFGSDPGSRIASSTMPLPAPQPDSMAVAIGADLAVEADRGRRTLIPGGPHVRASFAPNRLAPSWLVLPIAKRLMARKPT
jgi:hypothetical protein